MHHFSCDNCGKAILGQRYQLELADLETRADLCEHCRTVLIRPLILKPAAVALQKPSYEITCGKYFPEGS